MIEGETVTWRGLENLDDHWKSMVQLKGTIVKVAFDQNRKIFSFLVLLPDNTFRQLDCDDCKFIKEKVEHKVLKSDLLDMSE